MAVLFSLLALAVPARPVLAVGTIQLSVSQGSIGQTITVSGSGFYGTLPSETSIRGVNIIFGKINPGSQIDYGVDIHEILKTEQLTDGFFSTTVVVPENLTGAITNQAVSDGTYYVYVTYYFPPPSLPNYSPIVEVFTITSFTVTTPVINIDPDDGTVGSEVEINGTGFGPSETISVEYDGQIIAYSGDDDTNSSGAFGDTVIAIPPSVAGEHTITVADETPSASAEVEFTVEAEITVSPDSGTAGTTVQISGTGFAGEVNVIINFNGQAANTGTTDAQGSFSVTIAPTITTPGSYNIDADDGTNSASSSFEISTVTLTVTPPTGEAGTPVTVLGTGYLPNQFIIITFNDINVAPLTESNSNGAFAAQFEVPISTPGTHTITASDGTNTRDADFPITAPPATGSISPVTSVTTPGYVGSQLTLRGDGFTPSETIIITYAGTQLITATAGTDGRFSATIEVPESKGGEHTVTVTGAVSSSSLEYIFTMESTAPAIPSPLKPEMDVKTKAEAFFDWQDVDDPSGVTYTLQIATDENFAESAIVLEKTGLTLSEHTVSVEDRLMSVSQEAPYYWRIRALDKAGNESPWTGIGSFYVGSSFGISQGVIYTLIGVGALLLAAFTFWMGRKTAYY